MLPLRQYTIEDYYKFYRVMFPIIDRLVSENGEFEKHQYIRIEHHVLKEVLKNEFQQETALPPIAFRQFLDFMMGEMECDRIKPCDERIGVWWYNIGPYLNMRQYNPGVHDAICLIN